MPHPIQKYIAAILISILITSSVSGYSDEAIHSIEELGRHDQSIQELILQQEEYADTQSTSVSVFDTESELIGPSYVVERTSRLSGEVASRRVTSELLESTLVRNMTRDEATTPQITITEAAPDASIQAGQSFVRDGLTPQTLLTFEFGTPGEHLVFSTPVALSVDTPDIADGEFVDLRVHHAGESGYNTSGLMVDGDGVCLPDGTASRPASRAQVSGSKVSFYTCGASTFALGYVPSRDYPNATVWSLAPQTDGKVILGGAFTTVGGIAMGRVARVSTGGAIDPTFTNPNANNIVYATAVQADGKILIGGTFTLIGATARNYIARLNADGTLDATFNPNITVAGGNQVRAITVQPDGKILIGGIFATVGGVARNRIARLSADGTLDLTFNPNSNNNVYAITLQADGKILVGGAFTTIAGTARNRAARLLTTGAIDATFNPNANNVVWDIELFTTGDVILAGQFTTVGGVARNRIAKVSTLGVLDATWNPNANNNVLALSIDSSNNVIFGGTFTTVGVTARNRIARVSAAGVLDATWNPNAGSTVYAFTRRADGVLVIGGLFTAMFGVASAYVTYMSPTGVRESTYSIMPSSTVWSLAPQTDGKVILGGAFTTVGGIAMGRVARVSTGGAIDPTFTNPNANNIVYATAVQPDGKILIGGTFTLIGATARNYIARLNADGTLDATWNPNITVAGGNQVRAITIQADGKILIGGRFATVGGVARNRIARLNADGTLDLTFNPNSNNNVYAITLQADGKILVGGAFTTIAGTARNRAARLLTTGAIDATFNPNANNVVWDIELFTTGDVILAGQFTTVGGVARNRIAKVSTLGVLDATWNPNANNNVLALSIDSSNNVIFGGTFTTVGVTARNRIARVSATGVLDLTLDPNANNTVYALGRDTDTNLLVGGLFTTMSAKATAYFSWVGLNVDVTPPQILSVSLASGSLLPIGNFTVTTNYTDTGAGINTASVAITLERWNGVSWGANIVPTYLSASGATTTVATHTLTGVPYGKYRFRISVADIVGNVSAVSERIFFIDELNWSVSQDTVDIGDLTLSTQHNSAPSEFTITVETVGAPFTLTLSGTTLISHLSVIDHWTGSLGYGYEQYTTGYSDILSSILSPALLASQGANIHPDGNKRIYTYRIQYGARIDETTPAGDYQGLAGLQIVAQY